MLSRNDMFVGELLNRGDSNKVTRFFPSYKFMGCHKNSLVMKDLMEYLEITKNRWTIQICLLLSLV